MRDVVSVICEDTLLLSQLIEDGGADPATQYSENPKVGR
jgi:hypothetical protein